MQGPRPDLAAFTAQEANLLSQLQTLAVTNAPLRPSALAPLANIGFAALGAVAAVLPPKPSAAILAGVQSALTDHYNDSLRQLREAGVAESTNDVRAVLRVVRDVERAPEGAPRVPDILALQRLGEVSVAEGVAGVVAAGTKAMLALARTV
jgi:demethoxyubiquinone hydroxylase (CLK1/Coq7/Cat5 family)